MSDDNGGTLRYRIEQIERRFEKEPDLQVMQQRLNEQGEDISDLKQLVTRLTWALVTFSLTVAGSAVTIALTLASHQ